jgi:hypothetical protein
VLLLHGVQSEEPSVPGQGFAAQMLQLFNAAKHGPFNEPRQYQMRMLFKSFSHISAL